MSTATEPTSAAIADVLDKAAAHIDAVGWTQQDLYDLEQAVREDVMASKCRVCAIGAINTAVYGGPLYPVHETGLQAVAIGAENALKEHLALDNSTIPLWNDAPGREADEVTKALRDTAAGLREAQR